MHSARLILLKDALAAPSRGLPAAAAARSVLPALLAATAAALLVTAAFVPRVDFATPAEAALDASPQAATQTSHDREVAVEAARKLGTVGLYAGALLGPALRALGAAAALWLAFRVAGSAPPFLATLAVTALALLPLALKLLLSLPAVLRMRGVPADALDAALPSSLAALLPPAADGRLRGALGALDLFTLWSAALAALGMAAGAQVSRARSAAVVAILFVSWVLLAHVAVPGLLAPSGGPPRP
jgi:hypothetical protein